MSNSIKIINETYDTPGDIRASDGSRISTHITNDIPDEIRKNKPEAYRNLGPDGVVIPGSVLNIGDCVLGRYQMRESSDFQGKKEYVDKSIYVKKSKVGVVSKVLKNRIGDKNSLQIEIKHTRVPSVGDKFAATQAQKGTIGYIAEAYELPYITGNGSDDQNNPMLGVIPDIMMNPHAVPSRMTVGTLDEYIKSKVGVLQGKRIDATAFRDPLVEDTEKELVKMGLSYDGTHTMIDGKTGNVLKAKIYVGVCQYLRLVHEAIDKVQNRFIAGYIAKTHQPVTGIDNQGGQRLGEMEFDGLVTHGTVGMVQSFSTLYSDYHIVYTCRRCNTEVYPDKLGKFVCNTCNQPADLCFAQSTYVQKMLKNYAAAFGTKFSNHLTPIMDR